MPDRVKTLSLGVYRGMFDIIIVYGLSELQLREMWDHLKSMIRRLRREYKRENIFSHFEYLIREFDEKYVPTKEI